MTILEVMRHPDLFANWFRGSSWSAWIAFLTGLFGLPFDDAQRAIWMACTGRPESPTEPVREAWLICGRRSGKSRVLALVAVFLACFRDWRPHLAPGEMGVVLCIAADKRQARVILRFVRGMLYGVPALAQLVRRETADEIELTNGVAIEINSASFRSVRGYSIVAAMCDETAFWRSEESANPDREILDALRPAMATTPDSMLICASSPYARRGVLWEAYRRWWGKADAPALVWRASTRTMNPTVPEAIIAEAYDRDPAWAAAEYGAEFRTDVETFVAREVVDAVTVPGRYELPRIPGTRYHAFVDPSGGSSDSMTLAIAHADGELVILDAVREVRPPFDPERVVADFAYLLSSYGVLTVSGDRYGGEWVRAPFRDHGISYELADKPKSELYRDLLPALNARRVELLDHSRLASQLCGLERRTARGGRDSIDHAPGAHDDLANAVSGGLGLALATRSSLAIWKKLGENDGFILPAWTRTLLAS
jgi:hypothetical protein